MRRLFLTTASVIAITLGGGGLAFAAGSMNTGSSSTQGDMSGMQSQHTKSMHSQGMKNAGTSQSEVKQAQEQLKSQGLYHGQIDGIVGPETKQAVSQYQKKNGLHQTATLDQQTLSHLLGGQTSGSGSSGSMSTQQPSSGQSGTSGEQSSPQNESSGGASQGSSSSGQQKQ